MTELYNAPEAYHFDYQHNVGQIDKEAPSSVKITLCLYHVNRINQKIILCLNKEFSQAVCI